MLCFFAQISRWAHPGGSQTSLTFNYSGAIDGTGKHPGGTDKGSLQGRTERRGREEEEAASTETDASRLCWRPQPPAVWRPGRLDGLVWRSSAAAAASASARLLQGVDHLLQDVGAVICDLLQHWVGVLLQLTALLLTHLQLPLQLHTNQQQWLFLLPFKDLPFKVETQKYTFAKNWAI